MDAAYGKVALDSIDAALQAVHSGECSALVTAPIHKQSVAAAGSPFPGHTELLASRAGLSRYAHDYAMYFDSPLRQPWRDQDRPRLRYRTRRLWRPLERWRQRAADRQVECPLVYLPLALLDGDP